MEARWEELDLIEIFWFCVTNEKEKIKETSCRQRETYVTYMWCVSFQQTQRNCIVMGARYISGGLPYIEAKEIRKFVQSLIKLLRAPSKLAPTWLQPFLFLIPIGWFLESFCICLPLILKYFIFLNTLKKDM